MDVAGIRMDNPLMVCSGVLGISAGLFSRIEAVHAGAVVTKSISLVPNKGYDNPTVTGVASGVINAMGLPNPGVDAFIEELGRSEVSMPIVVSIYGNDEGEFAELARRLSPHCSALELNLSCPHAGGLLAIGQDPNLVERVVRAAKEASNVPVLAKLTPNVADITKIGLAAQEGGADAICAINTVKAMAIDIYQKHPILSNIGGGLSGPAIKPIGVRAVWDLAGAIDIPIIGIGGIASWEDVVEYLYAGASAVQMGTALGMYDIDHITRIKDELDIFCASTELDYEGLCGIVRKRYP